jgi:hypothetical protein
VTLDAAACHLSQSSSTYTNTNEQDGLDEHGLAALASQEDGLDKEGLAAFIEQEMLPTMQDADLENINIGDFPEVEEHMIELIMVCARLFPVRKSVTLETTVTL